MITTGGIGRAEGAAPALVVIFLLDVLLAL
jgi:hypothetical protein